MDPKELSPEDKIATCQNLLDKLTDAHGRAKCGYIYIINEILEALKEDITNQNSIKTE